MTDNRPKTVPFCKDCKHHNLGFCGHESFRDKIITDVVTGKNLFIDCKDMRADPDKCGWSAKWHEPK